MKSKVRGTTRLERGGILTFVASCGLGQCLQSRAEVASAKHVQIPTSIMSGFSVNTEHIYL